MFLYATVTQILCLAVVLTVIGRGALILLPKSIQTLGGRFFAPIFALAILVLLSVVYGWLKPFDFKLSLTLVGILCLFSFVVCERICQPTGIDGWALEAGRFGIFSLIASIPILAPLILFDTYNPYNDTYTYLVHSQWLQSNSFSQTVLASGNYPALSQVALYQGAGHRMGASFFLALSQSIFRDDWSFHTYIPVVSIFFSAGCYTVAAVVRRHFPIGKTFAVLIALVPSLSLNGFNFGAQYGFLPQTAGMSFFIAFIALIYFYVDYIQREAITVRDLFLRMVPVSTLIATILFCYNDMFLFVGAGTFLFFVATIWRMPSKSGLLFASLLFSLLQSMLLVNVEGYRIIRNFIDTVLNAASGTVIFGWPVNWDVIQFYAFSLGLKSPHDTSAFLVEKVVSIWLMPVILAGLFLILRQVRKTESGRTLTDLFLSFNILFALLFIKFRYLTPDIAGQQGHTFLQFKLAGWLGAVNLIIMAVSITWLLLLVRTSWRVKYAAYGFGIVFASFIHVFIGSPLLTNHFLAETERDSSSFNYFLELRSKLEPIPKEEVIYLGIPYEYHKLKQLITYVLFDRKLAGKYKDGYIRGKLPESDRDMPIDGAEWVLLHKPSTSQDQNPLNRHGPLYLTKSPFDYPQLISWNGGYATETAKGRTWNWVENEISYNFKVEKRQESSFITFDYLMAGSGRVMEIIVEAENGDVVFTDMLKLKPGWNSYVGERFLMHAGVLTVKINASGEPVRLSQGDSRMAKFLVQNIDIIKR